MSLLDKNAILSAQDLPYLDLPIPEWKGSVRLRGMSAADREALEQEVTDKNGKVITKHIRVKLLVRSIVDGDNNLMFTEGDIETLNKKSSLVIDRIFLAAQKLNGMSEAAVDDLAKN